MYMGDPWACGHYRMMWPGLAAAKEAGCDVEVVEPDVRRVAMTMDPRSGRVLGESFPQDADVIVWQRPSLVYLQQIIPMLQARGVAVVIDMDDDLTKIDPRNPAHRGYRPTVWHPGAKRFVPNPHNFNNATQACRLANLVTVTTPALAQRYGGKGHARVIPNYVPAAYLQVERRDSEVVGWGGVVHSHPDDLQAVGASLARLTRGEGVKFVTVGDKVGVARALGLGADPGGPGNVDFKDWAPNLACLGIGIAPLARTRFNEAKSRLKPLEYAAVGVPAVASPLPDYAAFAGEGGCLLADKPREWERILRRLVGDRAARDEQSHRGREAAAANTYEGHGWRWAEAWADAVKALRTGAAAAAV